MTRQPVFTSPFKPEPERLPPLGQLQQYRETLPPGDPRRKEVQGVIDNQTRPPKLAGGGGHGAAPVPKPEKVLPQAVVKLVTEARDNATAMNGLASTFKPEYAGKGVFGLGADMQMAASANLGADKDSVNWWKDYRKNIELVERHAMFGASLTVGEQGAWRSADISPGMDPEVIKRNLVTRQALAQKVLGNAEQDMIDAGHSEERVRNIAGRSWWRGNLSGGRCTAGRGYCRHSPLLVCCPCRVSGRQSTANATAPSPRSSPRSRTSLRQARIKCLNIALRR